ncbi:MAG: hypothetical protein EXX96DRAFT_555837 [Benjaminiella poitrasii]|nr:MAG: hypothetical protein EXX96DRAFT_555837 [Benjaminiella poitrasii]
MVHNRSIPSVKVAINTTAPSNILLEGYLMKQKHGKCKAWLKRYFILYEHEIRYYKSKNDTSHALVVIALDHYRLELNAHSLASLLNQRQPRKQHTFCLVSDDPTKYDWPDYFLQAANVTEYGMWIDRLEDYYASYALNSSSVLEKWLDRLQLPGSSSSKRQQQEIQHYQRQPEMTLSLPSSPQSLFFSSSSLSLSSSIHSNNTQHLLLQQPQKQQIRNHRSADSLSTMFRSVAALKRRPSADQFYYHQQHRSILQKRRPAYDRTVLVEEEDEDNVFVVINELYTPSISPKKAIIDYPL